MEFKVQRMNENAYIPTKATNGSIGYDLCTFSSILFILIDSFENENENKPIIKVKIKLFIILLINSTIFFVFNHFNVYNSQQSIFTNCFPFFIRYFSYFSLIIQ